MMTTKTSLSLANPMVWYSDRELPFVPNHFIKCPTPVTVTNTKWILNKTVGRYAFCHELTLERANLVFDDQRVYFENEKDAMLYELLWAGS
jgi:hypothetical protein